MTWQESGLIRRECETVEVECRENHKSPGGHCHKGNFFDLQTISKISTFVILPKMNIKVSDFGEWKIGFILDFNFHHLLTGALCHEKMLDEEEKISCVYFFNQGHLQSILKNIVTKTKTHC